MDLEIEIYNYTPKGPLLHEVSRLCALKKQNPKSGDFG